LKDTQLAKARLMAIGPTDKANSMIVEMLTISSCGRKRLFS
jgi:hypothetical protein